MSLCCLHAPQTSACSQLATRSCVLDATHCSPLHALICARAIACILRAAMATSSNQAAQQQPNHPQQQEQQGSSTLLAAPRLQAVFLAHASIFQEDRVLLRLLQACKQLQVEAAGQCAGQLVVNAVLNQPSRAQSFAAWLQRHDGLLRELRVKLGCSGSAGLAVLQSLQ